MGKEIPAEVKKLAAWFYSGEHLHIPQVLVDEKGKKVLW
jgi:hypothetical protein